MRANLVGGLHELALVRLDGCAPGLLLHLGQQKLRDEVGRNGLCAVERLVIAVCAGLLGSAVDKLGLLAHSLAGWSRRSKKM